MLQEIDKTSCIVFDMDIHALGRDYEALLELSACIKALGGSIEAVPGFGRVLIRCYREEDAIYFKLKYGKYILDETRNGNR